MEHLSNKRILITGANGALAKETIKYLVKDGYSDIVMAVRKKAKGLAAREEIPKSVTLAAKPNLSVVFRILKSRICWFLEYA